MCTTRTPAQGIPSSFSDQFISPRHPLPTHNVDTRTDALISLLAATVRKQSSRRFTGEPITGFGELT